MSDIDGYINNNRQDEDKDINIRHNLLRDYPSNSRIAVKDMMCNILPGMVDERLSIYKGCEDPTALVKYKDKTWAFTNDNSIIVSASEVVFGDSPEELIAKLEIYLGYKEPRLQFMYNASHGNRSTFVQILNVPLFHFKTMGEINTIMGLIDEYGEIEIRWSNMGEVSILRKELALQGYFLSMGTCLVNKNTKQAKEFLTRLKRKEKPKETTFRIFDIDRTMCAITSLIPPNISFRSRLTVYATFVDFILLLTIFEGIGGHGSRHRVDAYRQLIKKWKNSRRSKSFQQESVGPFIKWMDKEAALPENTESPIIEVISLQNVLDRLEIKSVGS